MNGQSSCVVVVADNDPLLSSDIQHFLSKEGITVEVAGDGRNVLDNFARLRPDCVLADTRLRLVDGFELLETIKKSGSLVPVILMVDVPDIACVMKAMQDGAFDCLIKPPQPAILLQKVHRAVEKTRLQRETIALHEVVQLNNVTTKLAATHNMDALLDIVFRYGFELTQAQSGAIFLREGDGDELVYARQRWPVAAQQWSPDDEAARCEAARWTLRNGRPLIIEGGKPRPEAAIHPACGGIHSLLSMPLRVSQTTMGVFLVERVAAALPFTMLECNRLEIIATQAGIAIDNVIHYDSLLRKLDELKSVGAFTEQFAGRTDTDEVVRLLFEKVRENCLVDVMGFVAAHRGRHEFLYWTRGTVDTANMQAIYGGCIDTCRHIPGFAGRPVSVKQLIGRIKPNGPVTFPLAFRHFTPIAWNGRCLGIFFAGSGRKPPDSGAVESLLKSLVDQTRIALIYSKLHDEMRENYLKSVEALAIAADAKDTYTKGHSEKVMAIAEEIAREVRDFDEDRVAALRDAALLHDIGKIGIPGHILTKAGALTTEEFNGIMKSHSERGANFVKDIPFLDDLYTIILHHHEHFDGSGYPGGLKGEAIPIGARILHIADAFDAMTSERPYRSSLGNTEAVRRLVADSGKHFDPAIVGHFLRIAKRKGIIA